MGEQNTMMNKVEATIYLREDTPINIIGILDEINYDANYPTIALEIRDVRFIEEKTDETDFDFTIKQGEVITKFVLGEDKILFETTQDYEAIQTLSKWLYSMYDEIQKLRIEKLFLEKRLGDENDR